MSDHFVPLFGRRVGQLSQLNTNRLDFVIPFKLIDQFGQIFIQQSASSWRRMLVNGALEELGTFQRYLKNIVYILEQRGVRIKALGALDGFEVSNHRWDSRRWDVLQANLQKGYPGFGWDTKN